MIKISKGIVFSYDIKRILNGINAFDYIYEYIPNDNIITNIRDNFEEDVNKIFNNEVTIITEEEMMKLNDLISGEYPHHIIR